MTTSVPPIDSTESPDDAKEDGETLEQDFGESATLEALRQFAADDRIRAAAKIQEAFRAYQVRKKLREETAQAEKERAAAIKLQAAFRGKLARKEFAALQQAAREQAAREQAEKERLARQRLALENDSAKKIQVVFRAHLDRNRLKAQQEQAERERLAREQAERERVAQELAAQERAAQELAAREQLAKENKAATKIQAVFRGQLARKEAAALRERMLEIERQRAEAVEHLRRTVEDKKALKSLGTGLLAAVLSVHDAEEPDKVIAGALTYRDLVAMGDAISQNVIARQADPMSFLTTSNIAAPTSVFVVLLSFSHYLRNFKGKRSDLLPGIELFLQATQSASAFASMVEYFKVSFSSAGSAATPIAAVAQPLAASAGGVLSLISLGKEAKTFHELETIGKRFDKVIAVSASFNGMLESDVTLQFFKTKIIQKLKRRKYRSVIGMSGAIAGIGASATTITALALGGTAAVLALTNPIGWACLGLATLTGFGVLGYKIGRRKYKEAKLEDQRRLDPGIPHYVRTTGEYHRLRIADFILRASMDDGMFSKEMIEAGKVFAWILYGGTVESAVAEAQIQQHAGIMAFIKG